MIVFTTSLAWFRGWPSLGEFGKSFSFILRKIIKNNGYPIIYIHLALLLKDIPTRARIELIDSVPY